MLTEEQAKNAGVGEPVRYNRSQSAAPSERLTNDSKSGRIESRTYTPLHLIFEQTKTLGEKAYAEYDPVLRRITLNLFFYNDLDFMKKKI